MRKTRKASTMEWEDLIQLAETKLERSRLKTSQLQAILAQFRRQADAGEPSPSDLSGLGTRLSKLLQHVSK